MQDRSQAKGYVESISHIPSSVGDKKGIIGMVRSITEGGGLRYLTPGDSVAANEKIITDNGMCVVIEYPMDTGTVVRVFM